MVKICFIGIYKRKGKKDKIITQKKSLQCIAGLYFERKNS